MNSSNLNPNNFSNVQPIDDSECFSFPKSVFKLFTHPTECFSGLTENTKLTPLVLTILAFSLILGLLATAPAIWQNASLYDYLYQQSGNEYFKSASNQVPTVASYIGTIIGLALGLIFGSGFNALYTFLFSKALKGHSSYKLNFALALLVQIFMIPFTLIAGILKYPLHTFVDVFSFAILQPVVNWGSPLYIISLNTTLYGIASIFIAAIGLKEISKISQKKALIVTVSQFLLGILIAYASIASMSLLLPK